jgi:hypothetical protein
MAIDIKMLRKTIRTSLETDDLLSLLDRAVELIPQDRLPELFKGFLNIDSLISTEDTVDQSLLDEVSSFYAESNAGVYYEDFRVNSRNFMDQSRGTMNWIAEFQRIMKRCINESATTEPAQLVESFDLLIELLDELDSGSDTIVFFADEGGAGEVWSSWEKLMPCYCQAFSAVAEPEDYARITVSIIKRHASYDSKKLLAIVSKMANAAQKKALKART